MEHENVLPVSPLKSNIRGKFISVGQKTMIINFYKSKLAEEANLPVDQRLKYKELIKYISKYLGIVQCTISVTLSEYKNDKTVSPPNNKKLRLTVVDKVDDFDKNAIRQKIHLFWVRREIPTLSKILSAINEDVTLPDFFCTSLRSILKDLNFEYTKISCNSALTERGDIVCWRRRYLESIRHFRLQGRLIYYLDETWVNAGETTSKTWVDKTVTSNRNAFITDDYDYE